MYWKKEKDSEIEEIRGIIGRIFDRAESGIIPLNSRDSLINKISEKVWKHQQHTKPDEKDDLLKEARKENKRRLDEIGNSLTGRFSKTAVKKVMVILTEDSERIFDPKKFHPDVKEFHQFDPLHHPWIDRENILIEEIHDLFDKYIRVEDIQALVGKHITAVPPNWKVYFLAEIFRECNLWPGRKTENAIDAMEKRFGVVDKKRQKRNEEREIIKKLADEYKLCEICGAVKPDCQCDLLKA